MQKFISGSGSASHTSCPHFSPPMSTAYGGDSFSLKHINTFHVYIVILNTYICFKKIYHKLKLVLTSLTVPQSYLQFCVLLYFIVSYLEKILLGYELLEGCQPNWFDFGD